MSSRNHIKNKKSALFGKNDLRIKMQQIRNVVKLATIAIMQENMAVLHIVYII